MEELERWSPRVEYDGSEKVECRPKNSHNILRGSNGSYGGSEDYESQVANRLKFDSKEEVKSPPRSNED